MGKGTKKATRGRRDERILVAVTDVGVEDRGQASMIDDRVRAERIVDSLIEHGVEPEAVSALQAKEVPLKVSYRWVVELEEKDVGRAVAVRWAAAAVRGIGRFLRDVAPARPFEFRIDRLVWMGLWLGSLFLLGVSLVASMSNGSAREVVVEISQFQEGAEFVEPTASPILTSPATASPISRGSNGSPTPAVGGAAQEPECAAGGVNQCTCSDFESQPVAQAFYEAHPPRPGQVVDPDGNGRMCEWLAGG